MSFLDKKSIEDIDVKGKRVLCRVDFNVPIQNGKITDTNRLTAAIPTIKKLSEEGAKLILCSHLGKPKGIPSSDFSLEPVAEKLSELMGKKITFANDDKVVSDKVKSIVNDMNPGDIVLLENTRFRAEETKNEETFSKELAELCDVFVNDAFGSAHRAHCSTAGVCDYVEVSAIGYLIKKEIDFLGKAVENPTRPFVAILGGAKVADKLNVIDRLLDKCDTLIIGGGMAYTFLKAQGKEIGESLLDESKISYCQDMLKKAEEKGKKLLLPIDAVTVKSFPEPIDTAVPTEVYDIDDIPKDSQGCDIGPQTMELYNNELNSAKTIIWNGPMGVFENPVLAAGTREIASTLSKIDGAITIIGGGDSAAAVNQMGFADKMSHISTGGGASLEFLEGKELPGVACISDK